MFDLSRHTTHDQPEPTNHFSHTTCPFFVALRFVTSDLSDGHPYFAYRSLPLSLSYAISRYAHVFFCHMSQLDRVKITPQNQHTDHGFLFGRDLDLIARGEWLVLCAVMSSIFSKWRRNAGGGNSSSSVQTVPQRARSQSLDAYALERSGIRSVQNNHVGNRRLVFLPTGGQKMMAV